MSAHSVRTCLQRPRRSAGCFFITLLLIAGCGPTVVSGGTAGRLKTDNNPLSDVQITVFPASGGDAIGRAVTDATGTFSLVNHDSTGALQLPSGSYVFVLESVGAPTELPGEYQDRDASPLRIDWTAGGPLELNVPGLSLL
jgi:hypothetical protein